MTSLDTGFSAYYSAVFGWLDKKDQGPCRGRRGGFLVFWCFRFLVESQNPLQGPRLGRRDGFLVFWCFRFLVEIQMPGQRPRRGRRDGFLVFWCFCFLVESQNPLQGPRLRLRKAGCFEPRKRRFAGFWASDVRSVDQVRIQACQFLEILVAGHEWDLGVDSQAACCLQCIGRSQPVLGSQSCRLVDDGAVQLDGDQSRVLEKLIESLQAFMIAMSHGVDTAFKKAQRRDGQGRLNPASGQACEDCLSRLSDRSVTFEQVDDGACIQENHVYRVQLPRSSASC